MITKQIDSQLSSYINGLHKDGMSVFVMADGMFRGAFFHGTRFVNQMRSQHNLGILETMVLGQASLCSALTIPTLKGQGKSVFRYDTRGPAAGFVAEADSHGTVRAYLLQNPIPIDKPLDSWDLSPFFGVGTVSVTRFLEGNTEPVTGTVEIMYKNIAKDLAWYYAKSEQIHTAFNTSIKFDANGRVIGAGGLFLQAMPGADDETILRAENAFNASPSFGEWFSEGGDRDDIIYGLFREFNPAVVLERDISFYCNCSKQGFERHLLNLSKEELLDIVNTDVNVPVEIFCHHCGSVYHFDKQELAKKI